MPQSMDPVDVVAAGLGDALVAVELDVYQDGGLWGRFIVGGLGVVGALLEGGVDGLLCLCEFVTDEACEGGLVRLVFGFLHWGWREEYCAR